MIELLDEEKLKHNIAEGKKDLEWQKNDDEDAFYSINTAEAAIDLQEQLLELIKHHGLKSSTGIVPFFKDEAGHLLKGRVINAPYADALVVLPNGKKVWLKNEVIAGSEEAGDAEYGLAPKKLAKYGLHEVSVNIPVYYRLSGDAMGHAWPTAYESPVNHVTGEPNPYWNL